MRRTARTAVVRMKISARTTASGGASNDPVIEETCQRQIKNLLATLLLSRGVLMLLGGDEFRRT
jgi:pullulanase/glycogen debranching enzyme